MQDHARAVSFFNDQLASEGAESGGGGGGKAPRCTYTAQQAVEEAQSALTEIARLQRRHLLARKTQRALDAASAEFCEYLRCCAMPGCNTVDTCTDIEVLVFLQAHYLKQHSGRKSDNVAPSTLDSAVSRLVRLFNSYGRTGKWYCPPGCQQPVGNPASSQRIEDFKRMYARMCKDDGYEEVSAVPLTEADFRAMIDCLDQRVQELVQLQSATALSHLHDILLLERDAAAFTVLWESWRRGQDILQLAWSGMYATVHGKLVPLVQYWQQNLLTLPMPDRVLAVPGKTKVEQTCRALSWSFLPQQQTRYCAIARLRRLFGVATAAKLPDFAEGWVFTATGRSAGQELQADALAKRLSDLQLKIAAHGPAVHVAAGHQRMYTLHSFRRGRLQMANAQGLPAECMMLKAGIKTFDILMRYLDEGRHLG